MYNCSALSPESLACLNKVKSNTSANPQIILVALARAVASRLSMPPECVKVSSEYYSMSCIKLARELISCFSDTMVVDAQATLEMVKTMWMVRYKAAYPSDIVYDTSAGLPSEASFLGFGSVISSNDIKFIQENSNILILVYNNFSKVFSELLDKEQETQ